MFYKLKSKFSDSKDSKSVENDISQNVSQNAPEEQTRREFFKLTSQKTLMGVSAGLAIGGSVSARYFIQTYKHKITLENKVLNGKKIKIAQISDLHVGPTVSKSFVEMVVEKTNSLNPDLIFLTGDMVDGYPKEIGNLTAPLKNLKSTFGTYFVSGNHEFYWGADSWREEFSSLGITILDNKVKEVNSENANFLLYGIPDRTGKIFKQKSKNLKQLLDPYTNKKYDNHIRIFLYHRPWMYQLASEHKTDLQLSGHTHGGQFFPWNIIVNIIYKYPKGLAKHNSMYINVNRGTGYWGPPNRLGIPSEITLIEASG